MKKSKKKTTTEKIFGSADFVKSKKAVKATKIYKETMEIIEKANYASGRTHRYETQNQSTRNLIIKDHGIKNTYKV